MPGRHPAKPLDVGSVLRDERATFVALLEGLSTNDWRRPTECPAWTVKGVALHILGDDLSLLSRQRDVAQPAVFRNEVGTWAGTYGSLDEFNERWVDMAQFFSPQVIVEMLRATGDWTGQWYATVDPTSLGESVAFVSNDPAPYWMIAAREYFERWIHHLQIRRAVGQPGLTEPGFVLPAVAMAVRAFPRAFGALPFGDGTAVVISIGDTGDGSWTVRRAGGRWLLDDGAIDSPTARLSWAVPSAALLFSRGLPPAEIGERVTVEGDRDLAATIIAGLAAVFGQPDA